MAKSEKGLVKKALEYYHDFVEAHADALTIYDTGFISETAAICKEIAKGEGLTKDEYELALAAFILSDTGLANATNPALNTTALTDKFLQDNNLQDDEKTEIRHYINFLKSDKSPASNIEKVIKDGKDIYLGLPDALERLSLMQMQDEKLNKVTYSELEWLLRCKQFFITHSFYTHYANQQYGATRSKNYIELEKRIDKMRFETAKEKSNHEKQTGAGLSGKENEDLFKIAFRNYINLIALADRKAGLLIQVNSILASVVVALVLRKIEDNPMLALPTAGLLIGSALTIFYSILASKPLERLKDPEIESGKEQFFFGSFDRLDPNFKRVSWEKYSTDMTDFFGGDKLVVFTDLIKESFEVRKVLSKKFGYLSIAYKIFFGGLLVAITGFLIVILQDSFKR